MYIVSEICNYTQNRARVKLDNGFTFALYKGELRKYNIKEDECLDENLLDEILHEVLYKRAKDRALYLLKDSSKTKKQICDKLKQSYYPEVVIDEVLNFLERYSYIDDYNYALNYIEYNYKRKSVMRMKNDLYIKGIDREVVENVLCTMPIDEEISIYNLIEKKIKRYNIENLKDRRKFIALLQRNGYGFDLINKALDSYRM